jgi:hypothetical protein
MRLRGVIGLLAAAAAVGVVAIFVSLFASGAGHGTNVPAYILLPWTMLLGLQVDQGTLLIVSLAQFPLYAALFAWERWTIVVIAAGHLAATAWLLTSNGYLL